LRRRSTGNKATMLNNQKLNGGKQSASNTPEARQALESILLKFGIRVVIQVFSVVIHVFTGEGLTNFVVTSKPTAKVDHLTPL